MKALILVDLQRDFFQNGALQIADAEAIIPVANRLMPLFDVVVATQDWHPANHQSFAANHLWRKPGQVMQINGQPQQLWVIHCVQNSYGAELVAELDRQNIDNFIQKGMSVDIDSYSAFFDNSGQQDTGLHDYLQQKGIERVYIMGVATDYCVKYTTLDALHLGYTTYLIADGCRGANLTAGDSERAMLEMRDSGAVWIAATDIF
jgi:nicotinamidase/pyrazinamidase